MSGELVAFGDSITRGGGEPMLGLPGSPWVQLLADTLGLECENLARDGATAGDVLHEQLPQFDHAAVLACLYVGVNDTRDPAWDAARFATDIDAILAILVARAHTTLLATIPEDLGRPTAAPKPLEANAIIRAAAGRHGVAVVALDDLTGRDVVLPDAVHLTALGEAEIARRALAALVARGLAPADAKLSAEPDRSPDALAAWRRLRAAWLARDLRRRRREREERSPG